MHLVLRFTSIPGLITDQNYREKERKEGRREGKRGWGEERRRTLLIQVIPSHNT